ncbi:MAG TPA: mannosyltransferase family protein [Actinomycetota bacterium]|nr:mannosyltransferase family protein [Actinomycetota bacterium]
MAVPSEVRAPRMRDGIPLCVSVFVCARLMLSLIGAVGVGHVTQYEPPADELPAGWRAATAGFHNAFDGTDRWDAGWYLRIARDGYGSRGSAAFFPGYPLTIRGLSPLVGDAGLAAALLISNAAFLAALIVFHQLGSEEFDVATARRSVVLLAAFPTAFFFLAPYSESLFLLLALLAFREARRDRWATSALAGAAAGFTRSIGIVLLPALLVEAIQRSRQDGRRATPRVLAACGVIVGPAAYLAIWAARGDVAAPLRAQSAFGRQQMVPFVALGRAIVLAAQGFRTPLATYRAVDLVITVPVLVAACVGWRGWRPSYTTYVGLGIVFLLSDTIWDRPLVSVPRYLIVFFPVWWTFARWLRDRGAFVLAVACSAIVWSALALAFMNWVPIF